MGLGGRRDVRRLVPRRDAGRRPRRGPTARGCARSRRSSSAIPVASNYEFFNHDGVPAPGPGRGQRPRLLAPCSRDAAAPGGLARAPGCQPAQLADAASADGDYTPRYAERDHTRYLARLRAGDPHVARPRRHARGSRTCSSGSSTACPGVPKHGLFGVFDHEQPDRFRSSAPQPRASWERADWDAMVVAWYDRHLRGRDNGIGAGPTARSRAPTASGGRRATGRAGPAAATPRCCWGRRGASGDRRRAARTTYHEVPAVELDADGYAPPPGAAAVFDDAAARRTGSSSSARPSSTCGSRSTGPTRISPWRSRRSAPDGERTIVEARSVGAGLCATSTRSSTGASGRRPAGRRRSARRIHVTGPARPDRPRRAPRRAPAHDGRRLAAAVRRSADGATEGLGASGPGPERAVAAPRRACHDPARLRASERAAIRAARPRRRSSSTSASSDERDAPLGATPAAPRPRSTAGASATAPACGAAARRPALIAPRLRLTVRAGPRGRWQPPCAAARSRRVRRAWSRAGRSPGSSQPRRRAAPAPAQPHRRRLRVHADPGRQRSHDAPAVPARRRRRLRQVRQVGTVLEVRARAALARPTSVAPHCAYGADAQATTSSGATPARSSPARTSRTQPAACPESGSGSSARSSSAPLAARRSAPPRGGGPLRR